MSDKAEQKNSRGRPVVYGPDTHICVRSTGESRLQKNTDRRAIVDLIIDEGGRMTMRQIDEHFGFSMQNKIAALRRSGWLDICDPEGAPEVTE